MEILISQHLSECDGSDRRRDLIPVLSRGITVTSLTVSARGYDIIPESAGPALNGHNIPKLLWKNSRSCCGSWQTASSASRFCSFTCRGLVHTGWRSHLGTHARPALRRWRVSACASGFRRWQRCHKVIFFSQSWSGHRALPGLSGAVTP